MFNKQTYAKMYYHFVWATKNKQPLITSDVEKDLYSYIGKIAIERKWHLLQLGGIQDHIHILLQKFSRDSVAQVASCIKSNSSRFIGENYLSSFGWQSGYGVFTVDKLSLPRLKNYIANQRQHHYDMSYEKELDLLLKRHDYEKN